MTGFIEPLDLQTILINILAGNLNIFVFLAVIFIAALAAMFRMPGIIAMVMFVLFAIFLKEYVGGLFLIVILLVGISVFYGIGRIFKY